MHRLSRSVLLGLSLLAASATASLAGPLGDFNALVFGNFSSGSSDVEGRLYAGGNVTLGSYSVGDKLTGAQVGGNTLVVGGDLTYTSGQVFHGNIVVGGSAAGVASNVYWGTVNNGYTITDNVGFANLPVDFVGEQARLTQASTQLGATAATGTANYQWSQLFLTGDGSSNTQVFNITAAQLSAATNIVVSGISDGTDVIVNVSGTSASWTNSGMDQFFERNRETVLFNFFEADSLHLGGIGVQGSILAAGADITSDYGVVWGQVVGASWSGHVQINDVTYEGPFPEPPTPDTPTPAPASLGLFLLGLFAARRMRRAA
jgi:choice-of-anchor A domain-containing protein/MYXO-CTERM domain-containing protein